MFIPLDLLVGPIVFPRKEPTILSSVIAFSGVKVWKSISEVMDTKVLFAEKIFYLIYI